MSWQIYYNFSKSVYAPEDYGYVTTSLQNNDSTYIWVSKVWLHFDWMDDKAYPKGCNTQLAPSQQSYVGSFDFQVPSNVVGTRRFKFGVEEQKWTGYAWTSPGLSWSEEKEIKIEPLVKYQAFVSRSIHQVDKPVADPFHCLISKWGFETVTVGLNVFANGRIVVMACSESGISYEGEAWGGGHGQFTYYFVDQGIVLGKLFFMLQFIFLKPSSSGLFRAGHLYA
ncbi:MAG: hypothetical protein QXI39_03210 [Candidatus Bathyarchaeia archaeon]